ncbi:helix-turn-helix transcriptional regulator [Heyndrickxia sp. FSL K6-6286]|uniref:helix-turn-helix domain-containing protein n=1 Tax=Heyndrickxia sp. FSL K6-6286 TaxID=2921510 RepID=UPI00315A1B02
MILEVKVKPNLMNVLKAKGMTQVQLSELSGVPQGSISRFDKNNRHVDSHIFAIAKTLDVNISDLFEVEYIYKNE